MKKVSRLKQMRHRARGLNDLRTTREIIQLKQVCVQRPSAAAVNATLLALLLTAVLLLGAGRAAMDRYPLPAEPGSKPTARCCCTVYSRYTDRRTPYHNTDPAGCRTQCEQCQ